jgi:hypothetical protein
MTAEALPRYPGIVESARRRLLPERFTTSAAPVSPRQIEVVHEIPLFEIPGATVEGRTINVHGRSIDAYNVTPTTDEPLKGRLFLANGWRGRASGNHAFIRHLTDSGFEVTTFTNDFTKGDKDTIREADEQLDTKGMPKITFVKAAAIGATLDAFPVTSVIERPGIVAHSEATIYAGIAAAAKDVDPAYFIQINSAGHAKKTSLPSMAYKGMRETMQHTELETDEIKERVAASDVIGYVREHRALARDELRGIRLISTDRLVEHLHEGGLPTAHIVGSQDIIFPKRQFNKLVKKGIFDYVGEVESGAHEISSSPQGYAREVLSAIGHFQTLGTAGKEQALFSS